MSAEQSGKAVFLSTDLYDRIDKKAKSAGFSSVEEYVISVLEDVLEEETDVIYSKEEEEEVKRRLRALGYLD